LEEEWVDRLADLDQSDSIAEQVTEFQTYLSPDMREDLWVPERRSSVRRAVRQEISARESLRPA
jgi:hypothetical protein